VAECERTVDGARRRRAVAARAEIRAALLRDLARIRGIQRRGYDPRDKEYLRLEALPISLAPLSVEK
jgi:hypothetical protein